MVIFGEGVLTVGGRMRETLGVGNTPYLDGDYNM